MSRKKKSKTNKDGTNDETITDIWIKWISYAALILTVLLVITYYFANFFTNYKVSAFYIYPLLIVGLVGLFHKTITELEISGFFRITLRKFKQLTEEIIEENTRSSILSITNTVYSTIIYRSDSVKFEIAKDSWKNYLNIKNLIDKSEISNDRKTTLLSPFQKCMLGIFQRKIIELSKDAFQEAISRDEIEITNKKEKNTILNKLTLARDKKKYTPEKLDKIIIKECFDTLKGLTGNDGQKAVYNKIQYIKYLIREMKCFDNKIVTSDDSFPFVENPDVFSKTLSNPT